MKKDLRFLLCEPFGGLRKETVDDLENVVKDFSVSFNLFCAKNYFYQYENIWKNYVGTSFTTEELYNKFVEGYDKKSN